MFYKLLFLINTFINEKGIIEVENIEILPMGEAWHVFIDKTSGRHFGCSQYRLLRKILSAGNYYTLGRMERNYDEMIAGCKYIIREL